jgi:hypothetical protein
VAFERWKYYKERSDSTDDPAEKERLRKEYRAYVSRRKRGELISGLVFFFVILIWICLCYLALH